MSLGRRDLLVRALFAGLTISVGLGNASAAKRKPLRRDAGHHKRRASKAARPLVMLDPGHGGKDPGAIGVTGTYEKRIALAAARLVKRHLEATGRYRVKLTRQRDSFIPLAQRVRLGERHDASLFVSLHADSLTKHTIRGASVYGFAAAASDRLSAELASRENSADRTVPPDLRGLKPDVREILSTLIVKETRIGSVAVQHAVVDHLKRRVVMLHNPARHARFVVLRSTMVPSVLIEMGFMSNRSDEKLLRQAGHRAVVARAITGAIDSYFVRARHGQLMLG
jgi:N-acetylmuramoyl-L-alanine amidase